MKVEVSADGRTIVVRDTAARVVEVSAGLPGEQGPAGEQGPPGEAGPAGPPGGRTILSGSGVPSSGLGADGDFYYDLTGLDWYGPKTAGAWGAGTSIVGPTGADGAPGADGADGAPGADGADGAPGADGKTWRHGVGAPSSGLGVDGDLYLDTAASSYYVKAAGSWGSGTSLVGPQGEQGDPGADGAPGSPGADGADGAPGASGADGKTILSGSGAPSGGLGVDGDFYIDTTASTLYGPKTTGAWGSGTSLVGPQGEQGEPGPAGGPDSTVTTVTASAMDLASNQRYFTKTASGALTWTFANVPASGAVVVLLELTNGGTGLQTWPASVDWPGGTAPTLTASGVDVLGFVTDDGGTIWRGVALMTDSK